MNSFGSLNEVKELPPFTLDRATNRALEIIHGEQSNTHMDTQSNIQYTAERYMDSLALYNKHGEQSNTHGQAENEQGEREEEIENVSGEPQVNLR